MAAIGMMKRPSQNTGDENNILSIPTNTAANGIDGQKLLKQKKNRIVKFKNNQRNVILIEILPVDDHKDEP